MEGIENKQEAIVSSDLVSRQFEEIIVEYPEITDREHKGKPYYSIKYVEGGEKYIGYGTYKPEVLSQYLKEYFMPSVEPKTKLIAEVKISKEDMQSAVDEAVEKIRAEMEVPEIIRCKDCKHNPKHEWFGCPMSHLSEKQRPETAW